MPRIHVMGASGTGTTTLGCALAETLGISHLDTDDFFWMPTDPPYTTPRAAGDRNALVSAATHRTGHWILSGSALKWNAGLEQIYDLVIFLQLDPEIRMARILAREERRYGERIREGGDMFQKSREFLAWAASYDKAGPERRSLAAHEDWLSTLTCSILRLDSALPTNDLVAAAIAHPLLRR